MWIGSYSTFKKVWLKDIDSYSLLDFIKILFNFRKCPKALGKKVVEFIYPLTL